MYTMYFPKPPILNGEGLAEELAALGHPGCEVVLVRAGTISVSGSISEADRVSIQGAVDAHVGQESVEGRKQKDWRQVLLNYADEARTDVQTWDTLGVNQKDRRHQRNTRMLVRLCRFLANGTMDTDA